MVSFGQLLILFFVLFLLFGDLAKISQRILVFFLNLKKLVEKKEEKEEKKNSH